MDDTWQALAQKQLPMSWEQPTILAADKPEDMAALQKLVADGKVLHFSDRIDLAAGELYDIDYPQEKDLPDDQKTKFADFKARFTPEHGNYAYFPWSQTLLHVPDKAALRQLRTSRNRNLILAEEQRKLYQATILVAGLSVGSNIVEALVSMGIGGTFIVADMDIIEPSNLNRIRAPYAHVGCHKADSIAMRMSEIDPYLKFQLYRDGVNETSLLEMLDTHRPDIIIDEMDQLKLKIAMRQEAKQRGLPVLSAADDGDSTIIDIERYDIDKEYQPFHGMIEQRVLDKIVSDEQIPRQQLGMAIGRYFIGPENIPLRMYQSLQEVGKTLPSWPQLGSAAAQSGIAVAFSSYKILTGQPLKAGRHVLGPEQVLDPNQDDPVYREQWNHYVSMLQSFNL